MSMDSPNGNRALGGLAPGGPIFRTSIMLNDTTPLHVHLVRGGRHSAFIDSGVRSMFPELLETMRRAGIGNDDLRFVLHTHSHHDHIGCNARLQDLTGCLLAADPTYAAWHADFERHYQEFARPFPNLVPDTPALRDEVLSILDQARPLDIELREGVTFDLGGGVRLTAISFPGHMLAEYGWFESSSRTLILGDAVTGLAWPIFHSHLDVAAYRATLRKLAAEVKRLDVTAILFAHFPAMTPSGLDDLLLEAATYIDTVEATLLRVAAESDTVSLETLWRETCSRNHRGQDFRALNMVHAHVQDLLERGIFRRVDVRSYALR